MLLLFTKCEILHYCNHLTRLAKEDETPAEERIYVDRPAKRSREEDERVAKAVSHTKAAMESARAGGVGGKAAVRGDGGPGDDGEEGPATVAAPGRGGSARDFGSAMREQMLEKRRQMGDDAPKARGEVGGGGGSIMPPPPVERTVIDADEDDADEEDADDDRPKDFRSERHDRIGALRMENKRKGIGRMNAPDAVSGEGQAAANCA